MSKSYLYLNVFFLSLFVFFSSCQNDTYLEPELTPKKYSYTIPNRISFDFSQQSINSRSIIPYNNSLVLKNIGDSDISGEFIVLAFNKNEKNYHNLSFIERGDILSLSKNESQAEIQMEQTNLLFSDNNVVASILNFNDAISDHKLNGFYKGELNIYNDDNEFFKSLTCTGYIDYQGKFMFFVEENDEDNIVVLQGNINTGNMISGKILKRDGTNLSPIVNITSDLLNLNGTNLSGKVSFTEESNERILQFNLTHQN
ncbi:hypothetical protein [Flavobacterium phragmitis]|uniref:Lipoprotein n=1 Tax=Flavobacterium phragmitis TaxID=739143 RepID=A0A1I1QGN8_9FLAO|nr:hypothetical protein [Flavobacterium phragmitis]SFD21162.1 hypothetical protein SAMN05216297_105288 [Flavobacterium phragmitis]